MNMLCFACCLLLVALQPSCSEYGQPSEPVSTLLPGTTWQLQQFDSLAGPTVTVSQADTILLTFNDDGRILGESHGLCGNRYYGAYTLPGGDSIRFYSVGSDKILCPKSVYWDYYDLLRKAEHYQRLGRRLTLECDRRSWRLVFRQAL